MSVAIKKVEGVETAEVRLNQGLATIRLKSVNKIRLEQLREVVENNGFTPREAQVKVVGQVTSDNGKLALKVKGVEGYHLNLAFGSKAQNLETQIKGRVGETLLVEGSIPPIQSRKEILSLEVSDFSGVDDGR